MLDGAQVRPGFQHVGGASVVKQMGVNGLLDAGPLTSVSAGVANGVLVEGLTDACGGGEQPTSRAIPLAVDRESFLQSFRERDISRDTTFTLTHPNDQVFLVDVGDLEKAAFVNPRSRRVERGHEGPMLEIAGAIQNTADIIGADDFRESDLLFRVRDLVVNQRCFSVFDIQILHGGAAYLERTGADSMVIEQMQEILANLSGSSLLRTRLSMRQDN
jgi:hypothetical protein